MYYTTYQLNENARQFISELESKIPTSIVVSSFSSDNNGVSMPCVSTSYDAIADFIMQLKTIDCVDNAYVASISKKDTDGEITYEFTVTVNYVPMMETLKLQLMMPGILKRQKQKLSKGGSRV